MWCNWHDHLKSFGAKRVDFSTTMRGGASAGKVVTGAKCLLFFECDDPDKKGVFESRYSVEGFVDKILCSERLEVTILNEEDFAYQAKDSKSGAYY